MSHLGYSTIMINTLKVTHFDSKQDSLALNTTKLDKPGNNHQKKSKNQTVVIININIL